MKENIYTIPVIDGFKENSECPFCAMHKKLDKDAVDYMLGPSYMEDDIRMDTNAMGFCKDHYKKMHRDQNRLGLALMMHTHLQKINTDLPDLSKQAPTSGSGKKSFFNKQSNENYSKLIAHLNEIDASCYICNKINNTFDRYIDTFFYLWKHNKEIIDFVKESNGFCLTHFRVLLEAGEKKLNAAGFEAFTSIVIPLQLENLKRLEDEMDWFIKKFDYRFSNEPWKNSKDALPRSIIKISSTNVDE